MAGKISFQSNYSGYRLKNKRELSSWIKSAIETEKLMCGTITIVLCSDDQLLEVNRQFLQHDYYTDIITFQYTDNQQVNGDLMISLDRVIENAKTFKVSTEKELHRVMIHGVLHLCGYKDKRKTDKELMTKKENTYLRKLVL